MTKAPWEHILTTFLGTYMDRSTLHGILITGSYAKNLQHKGSDLDIFLITKNSNAFRTRGNVVIDGVMVEYYMNTYRQVLKYFETDKEHYNPMIYFSMIEGKIVYEKYGVLTKLKRHARIWLDKPFPQMNATSVSFSKYVIADTLNKMKSLYDKGSDVFSFSYFVNLKSVYEFYAKYLRQPILKEYMLVDYFCENKRFSDILRDFPDKKFASLYYRALVSETKKEQITLYAQLSDYVLSQMGGFALDGWSLTLPVDYSNKRDIRSRVF